LPPVDDLANKRSWLPIYTTYYTATVAKRKMATAAEAGKIRSANVSAKSPTTSSQWTFAYDVVFRSQNPPQVWSDRRELRLPDYASRIQLPSAIARIKGPPFLPTWGQAHLAQVFHFQVLQQCLLHLKRPMYPTTKVVRRPVWLVLNLPIGRRGITPLPRKRRQ
jgi:hypothetical protein